MTTVSRPPAVLPVSGEPSAIDPVAVLRGLVHASKLTRLYPEGHPIVQQKLKELGDSIGNYLHDHPALNIDVVRRTVQLDGLPFEAEAEPALDDLAALNINSVHVQQGFRPDDLQKLVDLLCELAQDGAGDEPVEARLARRDIRHVSLGRLVPLDTRWQSRQWPGRPTGPLDPNYAESLRLAEATFDEVAAEGTVAAGAVHDLVDLLIFKVAPSSVAIAQVLAIKQYENLTYCHSVNTAMLALLIGKQLRLGEEIMTALVEAALLHDIGKTGIALDVVMKPGALDPRERKLIQAHTKLGAEILVRTAGLHPLTPTISLEHHRTTKGGGYPELGDGVVPHVLSQLVSVADVYEAVTGARPYREPMLPEQACLVLARLAGESLNTSLVKSFINAVTFFPVGTFVRTTDDELGVVIRTTPGDVMHPVVAIIDEALNRTSREVDTSERDASGSYLRHIAKTLTPDACGLDIASALTPA
jgi:putative nucleotidyltransferase with HDIG domain